MFEVAVESTFAAAHFLRDYKGKCERLHGHNYRVQVVVEGERLDASGMLVDFTDLKRELRELTERLDHVNLNEMPPFDAELNPSAENIARYVHDGLRPVVERAGNEARIAMVRVWETERQYATYRPRR